MVLTCRAGINRQELDGPGDVRQSYMASLESV